VSAGDFLTTYGDRSPLRTLGTSLAFRRVPWECLETPGFRAIARALALEAPTLVDQVVVVTSTHRGPDPAAMPDSWAEPFSYHQRFAALDWRTGLSREGSDLRLGARPGSIVADTPLEALEIAKAWAARVRARLGPEFDVLLGDANHIDHGHAEHDARKAAAVFERIENP